MSTSHNMPALPHAPAHLFHKPEHSGTMTAVAAAAYLGIEPSTLSIWRSTKRYPLPYIKVGRLVRYRTCDLDAFLTSRTVIDSK